MEKINYQDNGNEVVRKINDNFAEIGTLTPTDIVEQNANKVDLRGTMSQRSDLSFIFFSDIHGDTTSCKRLIDLANNWGDDYIDCIINGGDTVDRSSAEGLAWYHNLVEDSDIDVLTAVGNHDAWPTYPPGSYTTISNWNTKAQNYSLIGQYIPNEAGKNGNAPVMQGDSYCNFYKDYNEKIRVIVLNAAAVGTTNTNTEIYFDEATRTWFEAVLADAVTNELAVVVVSHYMLQKEKCKDFRYSSLSDYKQKSTPFQSYVPTYSYSNFDAMHTSNNAALSVKQFIDAGGEFICWISGHTHWDMVLEQGFTDTETYGFQPQIIIATAKSDWPAERIRYNQADGLKTLGRYTQDLLNYMTIDLTFKTITVMRIGLDTDRFGRHKGVMVYDYENHRIIYTE